MSHWTWNRDFIYVRADRSKKWTQLTIKKTKIKWFRVKLIISGNEMKISLILIWFIKKFTILLLKNFANIHKLRLIVSIFAPKFMIQNILKDSLTIKTSENQIFGQFEYWNLNKSKAIFGLQRLYWTNSAPGRRVSTLFLQNKAIFDQIKVLDQRTNIYSTH